MHKVTQVDDVKKKENKDGAFLQLLKLLIEIFALSNI